MLTSPSFIFKIILQSGFFSSIISGTDGINNIVSGVFNVKLTFGSWKGKILVPLNDV